MPLHLLSSNRVESLQEQLSTLLLSAPITNVFASETVLVPSQAMQRWLNIRLAQTQGVAANIDYSLPASWVWQVAAKVEQDDDAAVHDPLAREHMAWQILDLLPQLVSVPEFLPLQRYLGNELDGVKAWQLAQKIADVFDRYQFYRPDWIRCWSNAANNPQVSTEEYPSWQPLLWQALVSKQDRPHRVQLIDSFLKQLSAPELAPSVAKHIPERVCCFALSAVPPLFMDVLEAMSRHTHIFLFQHSPSAEYWADLRSKTQIARQRVEAPDEYQLYDTGNDLLASWGRQGQSFQDMWITRDTLESAQIESFDPPGVDSLLHSLQQSILDLNDEPETRTPDNSVELRICHSPLRECQVLHDALLREFESDASLKPEDVLVIVPEISRYAPYIEAVFRKRENEHNPFIPWNLSDISLADEHPLIQIFFRLLALPSSRFTYSEIMSYLEVPEIAARFDIGPDDLSLLSALFEECDVRWGIDGKHKREFDLPATQQNTWRAAIARLWSGFAIAQTPLWDEIAPVQNMGGQEGQVLGRFCAFFEALIYWRRSLRESRTGQQWQSTLGNMLAAMFQVTADGDERQQQIREVLAQLNQYAANQVLSFEVVASFLQESLGTHSVTSRYFSGGVTFCGMRPLRSLPFRVICILGMQDQAFPRRDTPIAFDAMAQKGRMGDPRKSDEDRYLLLETLLCAREKLYISYVGRSLKDNSDCQPSVLLRELLDYIDQRYVVAGEATTKLSQTFTKVMPMQAFSEHNYAGVVSYDHWWASVANALRETASVDSRASRCVDWPDVDLPTIREQTSEIDLGALKSFFDDPVKAFFNSRLRMFLVEDGALEDEETFALNALEEWSVNKSILDESLLAGDVEILRTLLNAQGRLPHGHRAQLSFEGSTQKLQGQIEKLEEYRGKASRRLELSVTFTAEALGLADSLPDVCLSGQSSDFYPGMGVLLHTPSKLRAKVFLRAWIEHLALCAAGALGRSEPTRLLCLDADLSLPVVESGRAKREVQALVSLFINGQQRPLPIFPNTTLAYAQVGFEPSNKVSSQWQGNAFYGIGGDGDNAYVALVLQNKDYDPQQCPDFQMMARILFELPIEMEVLP